MIVLIHPAIPAKTIPELIALAKKEPGKYTYASAGVGSGIHLGAELFAYMAGIKLMHVPYKGTGPALTDLLGGHVSMYFWSLPSAIGLVKRRQGARACRDRDASASDVFPDVPTVAETASRLRGGAALRHRRRPPARRARSSTSSTPRCGRRWPIPTRSPHGPRRHRPRRRRPEEYAADIDREERKWSEVVKRSGAAQAN